MEEEIHVCLHTDEILEEGQDVFWILDGYVQDGYENDYCHMTYGMSYQELFQENSEWDEEEQDYIVGDDVYYTTLP